MDLFFSKLGEIIVPSPLTGERVRVRGGYILFFVHSVKVIA